MKKLQIVKIEFLISLSICISAIMQAKPLTCNHATNIPLTSAKGLNGELKE